MGSQLLGSAAHRRYLAAGHCTDYPDHVLLSASAVAAIVPERYRESGFATADLVGNCDEGQSAQLSPAFIFSFLH